MLVFLLIVVDFLEEYVCENDKDERNYGSVWYGCGGRRRFVYSK